jgi:signal transduction histidine kinase/ActR/RegA family two-component response regulator
VRIRTQLSMLAAGVMLPLVLLVAFVTYTLWHQQRQAYEQRFLERVSALRLALDTELQGILGSLNATASSADLASPNIESLFQRRFGRLLASFPGWSAVVITDGQGKVLSQLRRPGTPALRLIPAQQIVAIAEGGRPFVSDLERTDQGEFVTYVATPIGGDPAASRAVVYAIIEHAHWLSFLRTYPISPQAALVLNDQRGMIIARTLNDERWVGKRASDSYLKRTPGKNEGAFQNTSLEGNTFHTAFSRSLHSGWLLATGVPSADVEGALMWQTLAVGSGTALALAGAFVAAWLLGRHINTSLTSLEAFAASWPRDDPRSASPLPIKEAETVRLTLIESGARMLAHEESLTVAVRAAAAGREAAESGGRAKDAFLGMLGHELRNPLSAIIAATAMLEASGTSSATAARARTILARQSAHLRGMLGDLIDTAELTKSNVVLQKSRVDLSQLVDRVISRFVDAGRSAHLSLRLELRPTIVDADPRRMEDVVLHLLENACQYTPEGGSVIVNVHVDNGEAVLSIEDTGAGIAAEFANQIFDLFSQGPRTIDRSEGGLGLGLTTVKGLVELHGGVVGVTSEGLGYGSTFTVRLPGGQSGSAAQDAASALSKPLPALPSVATGADDAPLRLTVVEDLPDSREVMEMLLSGAGRVVNVGEDGPSGVAAILQGPSDVALVDIGLPGFDGNEVARRVRQAPGGSRILLIALTGYGTADDRTRALAAGFDDFLVKPFDPDLFDDTLSAALQAKRRESG